MEMTWNGVLLAAGASRRMGRDKATLPAADGQPLWRRQLDVLAQAGADELLVSARAEQTWVPADITRVEDAVADAGPLAGVAAALARCDGTHLLVLAVDLPALPAEWFLELQRACAPGRGAAGLYSGGPARERRDGMTGDELPALTRRVTGGTQEAGNLPALPSRATRSGTAGGARRFEPLAAIYPRELAAWADEALARRELALQALLRRAVAAGLMAAVPIAPGREAWFENWNEPRPAASPCSPRAR
jgi:molybdopterin-guanine dinucleotide biosynthesis protein A